MAAGKAPRLELGILCVTIGQEQSTGNTLIVEAMNANERNSKHADQLVKKMLAFAKKQRIHLGHVDYFVHDGVHHVTIENSNGGIRGGFADDMHDIVAASALAMFVEKQEFPGSFDWKADTYVKDASSVSFRF